MKVTLPAEVTYISLKDCVDLQMLHEAQGRLYESLEIKMTSFADSFARIIELANTHEDHKDKSPINLDCDTSVLTDPLMSSPDSLVAQEERAGRVSYCKSVCALCSADFHYKTFLRQMLYVFLFCALIIGQEAFFVEIFLMLSQGETEFNKIGEVFEENHPPILTFVNELTPSGTSTEALTHLYLSNVNEETDSVILGPMDWVPVAGTDLFDVMTEAAEQV